MCSGHCAGLFQTIRDEGTDEQGRGALNFLGGLVDVVDDPTNDELEVHIGKQPDLTDLFVTANAAPHLTIGGTGKTVRVNDDLHVGSRAGVGAAPTNAQRVAVDQASVSVNPTGTLYDMILVTITGTLGKALTRWAGIAFTGTLTVAGFNITSVLGLNFTPTISFNTGSGAYTDVEGARLGMIVTGAGTPTITNIAGARTTPSAVPAGHTVTNRRSLWARAASAAVGGTLTTDIGVDIEPPLGGATNNFVLRALGVDVPSLIRHALLIGGATDLQVPAVSALLDLDSTTGALLVPRMTTAQKNALTAQVGMIVYDTTLNQFEGYQGAVPGWAVM